jgi:hypothetical protein
MKMLILVCLITLAFAYTKGSQNETHNKTSVHLTFDGVVEFRRPETYGVPVRTKGDLFVPDLKLGEPAYINGTALQLDDPESNTTYETIPYEIKGFVEEFLDYNGAVIILFREVLIDHQKWSLNLERKSGMKVAYLLSNETRKYIKGGVTFESGDGLHFKRLPYRIKHLQNIIY